MIYTGLGRVGEIADVKSHGGADVAAVYGGIGNSNPIYYKQREMVGTSPMQFKALGLPLKDYRIYGETLQEGTPSPDMPVDVVGCGVRTENLFDDVILQNNKGLDFSGSVTDFDGRVATGKPIDVSNISTVTLKYTGTGINFIYATFKSGILVERFAGKYTGDVIRTNNCDELYICFYSVSAITKDDVSNIMLNLGSTALPYEPYGYKIPVTIGNTTTPIYIGSEPLHRIGEYADYVDYSSGKIVRKIKKLELTGEEEYKKNYIHESTSYLYYVSRSIFPGSIGITPVICNELPVRATAPIEAIGINTTNQFPFVYFNFGADIMNAQPSGNTVAGFEEYLAAQYAAGTPVTVWYVLETPTEEDPPVPFPELTTLSGTNTLTVDTTVKPSEIDLTGRIKTSGYGQLLDKNLTAINDSTGMPIFIR